MSKSLQVNKILEVDLNDEFKIAFDKISELKIGIAPDLMLMLYAYYKQANYGNNFTFKRESNVRDGFKLNAWRQLNGMTSDEAKKEYIALANKILTNKNK